MVMVIWYALANSHNKFRRFCDCIATFISEWTKLALGVHKTGGLVGIGDNSHISAFAWHSRGIHL